MNKDVIVVIPDGLIIVDGYALNFDFALPEGLPTGLHAIQWHDGRGHMELTDSHNQELAGQELYDTEVAPFVSLWEAEKYRLDNPPPLTFAEINERRSAEINTELDGIDQRSIRPLRAIDNGIDTPEDHQKLLDLEAQAATLRDELKALG